MLQRGKKREEEERNASPTLSLFHQDLFYFCSVPFISFHWPAVCLYSHIKVTFATPFPPNPPPPLLLVWRPEKKRHIEQGGVTTHIFQAARQYLTCGVIFTSQLEFSYLKSLPQTPQLMFLGVSAAVRH